MKALVLGGTQFISQAVAQTLVACGHETPLSHADVAPSPLPAWRGTTVPTAAMPKACAVARRPIRRRVRLLGLRSLRRAYRARGPAPDERTAYVFLSSGAVYLPSPQPVAEDAPTGPNEAWGAYGLDKLAAEAADLRAGLSAGFQLSIVRPAYVYGPGNNLYRESFLFDRLERGVPVPVPVPAGETRTQFAFIDDVVRLLLSLPGAHEGVEAFNCACPEAIGWERLVHAAAAAMGVEPHVARVPYEGVLEPRSFFPFRDCTYLLDMAKAGRFAVERPSTGLEEGCGARTPGTVFTHPAAPDPKMTNVEVALGL